MEDFRKYATKHLGMSGTALDSYMNISSSYISPDNYRGTTAECRSNGCLLSVDDGPYYFLGHASG